MISLFQSSLPASAHLSIVGALDALDAGEMGHELAILIPSVRAIVEDAAVVREVKRMLGPSATLDGCMHVHLNDSRVNGLWHRDDYCGKPWPRPMAILCYFPQDTPPEMGPTEVRYGMRAPSGVFAASGSATCPILFGIGRSVNPPTITRCQTLATGPAGTCLLMRNDVEHRATANRTGRQRYMLKFLFGYKGDEL